MKLKSIAGSGCQRIRLLPRATRRGAMMVFVAAIMVGFLVTAVFSLDLAYMHLARTELRSATDAATKAAALELSESQDPGAALARAQQIASQHLVFGKPLIVKQSDIEFGLSSKDSTGRFIFDPDGTPINSVRIHADRTQQPSRGAFKLFFEGLTNNNENASQESMLANTSRSR